MTSEPELHIEDDPKPEQMMEVQDRLYEFNDAVTAKADDGRRRGWHTLAEVPGYPGDTTRVLFRKTLGHSDGSVVRS